MPNYPRQTVDIAEVSIYREDVEQSLRLYYSAAATNPRFIGYSLPEVRTELDRRVAELELASTLILLSAVEAAFREDFRLRCYRKPLDNLSAAFRRLKVKRGDRVRLEADIFEAWKTWTNVDLGTIGQLKGAFKLRHWIAHGRYWDANVGRTYDFFSIQTLAQTVFNQFPFFVR